MELKLCDSDYRFMLIVWENAPVKSGRLVELCSETLGWKKSTTYTVLKKLCNKGFVQNIDATVTALVEKDECQAEESATFVNDRFGGSLPAFMAAFLRDRKITEEDAEEIKSMISQFRGEEN